MLFDATCNKIYFLTIHYSLQVDPNSRQKKQVELYQLMVDLVKAEDTCRERVRDSELEVPSQNSTTCTQQSRCGL